MGELIDSVENELIDIIRQDNSEKMISIITKNNINKNTLIGPHKRTLIQLCSYFGSINCLENLIILYFPKLLYYRFIFFLKPCVINYILLR